jgi:hypothetical protein
MLIYVSGVQLIRDKIMSAQSPVSNTVLKRRLTRSRKTRLLARAAKVHWREKIFNQLTAGMSVSLIAAQEGISIRRMRETIQQILDARNVDPAGGFAQLQMARLQDAMMVAHTAMLSGNLEAVDRVVKLVHEMERYRDSHLDADARPATRLPAHQAPRALPAPEEAEFRIVNG